MKRYFSLRKHWIVYSCCGKKERTINRFLCDECFANDGHYHSISFSAKDVRALSEYLLEKEYEQYRMHGSWFNNKKPRGKRGKMAERVQVQKERPHDTRRNKEREAKRSA